MFKRITKSKARKLFDDGYNIYLLPNKMRVDNSWMHPAEINYCFELSFDGAINAYKYYNCNNECGNVVAYYIYEREGFNWK